MTIPVLFAVLMAALFGLGFGSFLNVFVLRTFSGETLTGRSHCVSCQKQIAWFDLIPVFSYLFLLGKCRYCKKGISAQYPIVEFCCATLLVIIAVWFYGEPIQMAIYMMYVFFLLAIFIYDLKYYLIPDILTLPGIVLAVIGSLILGFSWWNIFLGMLVGGGIFFAQYVFSKGRWIGGGDIRLGLLMGAMLGFPNIIVALFLAYLFGAAIAVPLVITRKKNRKDKLPFGTFLTFATFITILFGDKIMNWYLYGVIGL
ncbi:MAG: prepilin peptidase [bacterium]|nr:prepilin peptidase [bacterium]